MVSLLILLTFRHLYIWICVTVNINITVKCVPVTGPVVAQRVGRSIALLFHDGGTRRGWVVSSTPRPCFTPGKDPVPIVQEAGWAPGPGTTGAKSRPTGIRSPDRPARSQSLYRLSYPAHRNITVSRTCCDNFFVEGTDVFKITARPIRTYVSVYRNCRLPLVIG